MRTPRTITEVDARRSIPHDEPGPGGHIVKQPQPREWSDTEESPTGVRAAEALASELEKKQRALNEALEKLEELKRQSSPVQSELEPPSAEFELRAKGKAKGARAIYTFLLLVGAGGAGYGGTQVDRAVRNVQDPATKPQVQNVAEDTKALADRLKAVEEHLASASKDNEELKDFIAAYMCSQRRVLARNIDCQQVLSTIQVNPDPLSATKPLPQLIIRDAGMPLPRLFGTK